MGLRARNGWKTDGGEEEGEEGGTSQVKTGVEREEYKLMLAIMMKNGIRTSWEVDSLCHVNIAVNLLRWSLMVHMADSVFQV